MTTRILSTSPLVGTSLSDLGSQFPDLQISAFRSEHWQQSLTGCEALVVLLSEPLSPQDLEKAPKLRVIGTYSVGINHLPQDYCQTRQIKIINTPGVLTDATADLALTLLMALSRRVAEGEALVRGGTWQGWAPDQLLGTGLAGKFAGILGSGPIGRAFAKRTWALGMTPMFWDREGSRGTVDFGPDVAPRLPLDELLTKSAVLSLHCPLTSDTKGLLTREKLDLLPKGALVINTARGGILDEDALIAKLHTQDIGGVGLDVYEGEPKLKPAWLQAPNTVFLPHLGSATIETRKAMARCLCDGIAAALS